MSPPPIKRTGKFQVCLVQKIRAVLIKISQTTNKTAIIKKPRFQYYKDFLYSSIPFCMGDNH
ncbi:hypothetical protein B4V05_05920 [Latilactobacillus sakei]|nr:hypothetical protein B4V05_05920 [Latilactobacillus sakei]